MNVKYNVYPFNTSTYINGSISSFSWTKKEALSNRIVFNEKNASDGNSLLLSTLPIPMLFLELQLALNFAHFLGIIFSGIETLLLVVLFL